MAALEIHMSSHWLLWDKQETGRWWCEERRFSFKLHGSAWDIKPPFVIISQDHMSSSHVHIGQSRDPSVRTLRAVDMNTLMCHCTHF